MCFICFLRSLPFKCVLYVFHDIAYHFHVFYVFLPMWLTISMCFMFFPCITYNFHMFHMFSICSLPSVTLMSSCGIELQDLIHQLDIVLSNQKQQWFDERKKLVVCRDVFVIHLEIHVMFFGVYIVLLITSW